MYQSNEKQKLSQNVNINNFITQNTNTHTEFEQLTEEAIDDWIAQSQNRPIMSFLDPHKRFNAPASLIGQFKNRYKSWMKQKDKEHEKKMLYFDDKSKYMQNNNIYQRAQQLKEQKNRKINVPLEKLKPQYIQGTLISQREDQFWEQKQKEIAQKKLLELQQSKLQRKLKTSPILKGLENYVLIESKGDKTKQQQDKQKDVGFNNNDNSNRNNSAKRPQSQLSDVQSQQLDSIRKTGQSLKPTEYNWEKDRILKKEINFKIDKLLEEDLEKPAVLSDYNRLDQHPNEITNLEKDKNNLDNVDFAFYRGIRRMAKGNYELAIQNFKQTLNFDRFHFQSVYNLACCYERLRKFETAKKWFEVSQIFPFHFCENHLDNIQYGLAICYYKTQNFQYSLDLIEELAEEQKDVQEDKKHEYLYLRCLCEKIQQKFDSVQINYKSFIHFTSPKNFVMLMHLMFAIVFKNLRGLEIKLDPLTTCEFNTVVHQIMASKVMQEVLTNLYDFVQQKWKAKQNRVVFEMLKLNFFKRFTEQQLNQFYPHFQFSKIQKSQVIFPQKQIINIIVAGHVAVYNHQKNFKQPDIVAYYTEGDIIGCDDKDNKLSQLPDIWFVTLTQVELISITREQFNILWKQQQQAAEKVAILEQLKKNPIFTGVSELTMYTLAYELIETKEHKKGDIMYNDNECQEKYTYIQLVKEKGKKIVNFKNRLNKKLDLFDYYHKKMDGFHIILSGEVECETPGHTLNNQSQQKIKQQKQETVVQFQQQQQQQQELNWINSPSVLTLTNMDYFGENLLFNSIGLSRFGRLKAKSNQVTTLMLDKNLFYRMNQLDRDLMKINAKNRPYFKQCQNLLYKYYKSQKLAEE